MQEEPLYPVISSDPDEQMRYIESRRKGTSHNMALMFATRKPPALKGVDRNYMEGFGVHRNGLEGTPEPIREMYYDMARKAGVSIQGKRYVSGLARRPGDPLAWCADGNDVVQRAKSLGKHVSGAVEYHPEPVEPQPEGDDCRLAEDIVQDEMMSRIEKDPPLKDDLKRVRDDVIEQHGEPK